MNHAEASSDFQVHGLFAHHWRGERSSLAAFHRHNEIELNFLADGRLTYTIAGRSVPLQPRTLSLFWGGFSHRVSDWKPFGDIWSLSLPLTTFLSWRLPQESFVYPLLDGALLHETSAERSQYDWDSMCRWHEDLHRDENEGTEKRREALLLEIQARLLRLSMHAEGTRAPTGENAKPERVGKMLLYIAEHYRVPELSVQDVARDADTNTTYAMEVFKKTCGMSIMQYVNDQRVTHAQRLLSTTDDKVLDIAMEAGFGSLSQFYAVFGKVCGKTPREYTRAIAAGVSEK